jgi:D-amino-acid dehydrogenase
MKTLVLGAGVVGVTTAYYLAREGHEVHVVDAATEVGSDATAGNAGLIAPGHSFAWASPRAPGMLLRSLLGQQTAIRVKLKPDPGLYAWGLRFLRECTADRAVRNTLGKLRLCQYSQRCLNELAAEENIDYHQINSGVLYLYRDPRELEAGAKRMSLLAEHGQKQEILDADGVVRLEPALEPVKHKFAGAVYAPTDASGDAQVFSQNLARICERLGVTFELGRRVRALMAEGDEVTGVVTDVGILRADQYVLSLGVGSPKVARTIGVRLPIYPAKGYSVTFPTGGGYSPPTIGGVDEQTLVAWSRQGGGLRFTSTAEFAGYDRGWSASDFANILRIARDLFPEAADYSRGRCRSCLRPMTPDGPPVIGLGPHRNLWYNTGHGHMGWTMACGSSRAVVDLMVGRSPEIDLSGNEYRW